MDGWLANHIKPILDSLLYSIVGTTVLLASFWVIEKLMPFSIAKEIEHDQNVGLGIILGAFILGISIIISSAIRG
jgi:putative membrane protein